MSEEILEAIARSFAQDERADVAERLATVGSVWMRRVILLLADGDGAELRDLITLNACDYRDVLVRFHALPEDEVLRRRARLGLSQPLVPSEANARRQWQEVASFVAEELIVPMAQLTASTELQGDLGLAGDAGDRFVRAFAARFDVDLGGYTAGAYFAAQAGEHPWQDLKAVVQRRREAKRTPITMAHLVQIAALGRWNIA